MLINKLLPYILIGIIIIINSLFWSKVSLPYVNPEDVRGVYSQNSYSSHNDTLRFLIYIFLPVIFYFVYNFLIKHKKKSIYQNFTKIREIGKDDYSEYKIIFSFFLTIIILSFLSLDFPLQKLDIFHEGQLLTGAMNHLQKQNFWEGSYLNTGLFYDQINTIIAFKLFNIQSIGAFRIFQIILQNLTSILMLIFCFSLSKNIKLEINLKRLFVILFVIFGLLFVKENLIYYRHIPIILFLIFINEIIFNYTKKINYICLGLISSFSFFWSIDIGAYVLATLFIFIVILIFNKRIKEFWLVFFSFFGLFLFTYLIVGQEDFKSFILNTLNQYRFNELYNGIIHPEPFTDQKDSARATKSLIIFIINGLILVNIFFQKNKKISNELYLFLILFYIISIFNYKTGLSRSDGGHIKLGSSFTYLLFIYLSMIKIFYLFVEKKIILKNFLIKSLITIFITFFVFLSQFNEKNSFKNFMTFKKNLFKTINKKDNFYLNEDYIELIKELRYLTLDLNCFQVFNYEPTIYYLIDKKSCTKYYQIQSIGSISDQKKMIYEMTKLKPKYLLTGGDYENWGIKPSLRFPLIQDYITNEYEFYKKINNHKILILIE